MRMQSEVGGLPAHRKWGGDNTYSKLVFSRCETYERNILDNTLRRVSINNADTVLFYYYYAVYLRMICIRVFVHTCNIEWCY
jgi:hypothetical protein